MLLTAAESGAKKNVNQKFQLPGNALQKGSPKFRLDITTDYDQFDVVIILNKQTITEVEPHSIHPPAGI